MTNETPTMRTLLEFEESKPSALFKTAPNSEAYLWPLTRWPIASALASAHLNVTAHQAAPRKIATSEYLRLVAREFLPSPKSSDRLRGPVDHLFMVSGVTRTAATHGVGNWLSDSYAFALNENAAVIQETELDLLTPKDEQAAFPRTWTRERVVTRIGRKARKHPLSSEDQNSVVNYLEKIFSELDQTLPASKHEEIIQEVLGRVSRLPYADAAFHDLLDRVRPHRIYMEDASYGHYSSSIRIAHERGVEVAELQHGWIGASHAAYNYGSVWKGSPLSSSLPDTLLTFGDYWGEELRFPGNIVTIGKPHLEEAARIAPDFPERKKRLLVVSSVYELDRLTAATKQLRALLPEQWEIVIRPHPSERIDAESIFAEALAHGATLDEERDVNASVASSRAVVGLVSTVLFEALALGVHIGVIESDLAAFYANDSVFPRRLDTDASFTDFTETLISGETPNIEATRSIWQPGAVENFLAAFATS
jgi:hypothetical protein